MIEPFDCFEAKRPLAGALHWRKLPAHLPACGSEFCDMPITCESAPIVFCDAVSGKNDRDAIPAVGCVEPLCLLHTTFPLQSRAAADHVDLRKYLALVARAEARRSGESLTAETKRCEQKSRA